MTTTYFSDSFTGTDGASWNSSNWTTSNISALNTTGASATIQTNRGRLNAGSVTGYGGHAARRYNGTNLTDAEMSGTIIFNDTVDGSFECWIRSSTTAIDGTGWIFYLERGTTDNVKLILADAYDYTTLAIVSMTISQSTEYSWRHYCVGSDHKVKVWATSGSEPGTWTIDEVDASVSGSGYIYVHAHGGNSASFDVDLDNILLTDGSGDVSATYTGSISASGAFARTSVTKGFTGSTTPSGVFVGLKVVEQILTGSITAVGNLARSASKIFTGSSTATGVNTKTASKNFTGSSTASGAWDKSLIKVLTGSITATGASVITFVGRVFGRPGRVSVLVEKAGEVRMRIRRG